MANNPQVPETSKPPVKDNERAHLALELSKVIIPVVGTILAACLSGIFLILTNSNLLKAAAIISPTVLVVTATPQPTALPQPPATATPQPLAPTQNAAPLPTPTPADVTTWKLVYRDDFSDPNSGWGHEETDTRKYEYIDGGYQLTVKANGKSLFGFPTMNRLLKDVRVEVDTIKMAGDEPYEIGLVCREETNLSLYALEYYYANGVGKFGIFKWNAGSYQTLGEALISDPTMINPGKQANRLRAECIGPSLSLWINSKKVLEVIDASLKSGNVGFLAGYSKDVQVFFDNFAVYEPGR